MATRPELLTDGESVIADTRTHRTYTITSKRRITREPLTSRRGHDIPVVERVQHQLTDLLGGLHHRD